MRISGTTVHTPAVAMSTVAIRSLATTGPSVRKVSKESATTKPT